MNVKTRLNLEITDLMALTKRAIAVFDGVKPGIQMHDALKGLCLPLDRRQITQVLKNVLENALKYTPEDGHQVMVTLKREKAQAVIIVSDDGIGSPEADLPFVFEPFFRVNKARTPGIGGYGLGLSLVSVHP